MTRLYWLAGVALAAMAAPVRAEDPAADDKTSPPPPPVTEVVVTGVSIHSERDVLSGTSIVSGEQLTRDGRATIGETLAHQPGVSATSFGPSASRPILRGFQGDRIRVLTDGIGSIDVSNTSVDHAVAINPLLAERIEVLRGPAALLFGSSATGGVVNVIDRRIPRELPENGVARIDVGAGYGSAANERSFSAATDVQVAHNFVVHTDGSYLATDDVHIGGFALTPARRAEALASAQLPQNPAPGEDPIDFAGNAAIRGTLPNTASQTWNVGFGGTLITDNGSIGIVYSHYANRYGVPIRYATLPGQGEEAPTLDQVQNRVDLRAEIAPQGAVFSKIRFRAGYARYRHFELAPDGTINTAFRSAGFEGRLELVQTRRGAWSGASGVQYFSRDFDVAGDEAFLPRNSTEQVGIFTQQQLDFGRLKFEGGVRYESTSQRSNVALDDLRFPSAKRQFSAVSGAVGGSYGISHAVRLGINLSRTERAPSSEELFANGPHGGTQAYELGNPNFALEKSYGVEATLHVHHDRFNFDASAYHNWFTNFIVDTQAPQAVCEAAAAPSGRVVDLPCFPQIQGNARYYGFEAQGSVRVARIGATTINLDALGDYVHATIARVGPVPRIPAGRVLGGIEAQAEKFTGRFEVEHVFEQTRIADFETPTAGYTLVNASLAFKPFGTDRISVVLSANNLFDVDARRHASFIKDFAPLPGRDIRLTFKYGI